MNQLKIGAVLSYLKILMTVIVGLVYTPIIIKMLGQSEYGLYSLIGALAGYLNILDMGLGNTVVRYISRNRVIGDKKRESELGGLFLSIYLLIGLITILTGYIFYTHIHTIFVNFSKEEILRAKMMLILLISNLALSFPLSIFSSLMQAYEKFTIVRLVEICKLILTPFIVVPFLYNGYGAVMIVLVTVVLNITSFLSYVHYCFRYLNVKFKYGKYKSVFLLEVAGYSFYIFLNAIMDKVYWGTGQFILGIVSGTMKVAIYAVAMQFMMMYMQFSTAISGVLLPKVTMMVANNANEQELTELMIKIGRLQFFVVGYIFLSFVLIGKDFLYLWIGKNYLAAYPIVVILMLALIIPLLQNVGISILQAKNLNRYRMMVYSIFAGLDVIFCIPMAKYWGEMGCAITTAIALVISTGFFMNIYYKNKIKLDIILFWKKIFYVSRPFFLLMIIGIVINLFFLVKYSWLEFIIKIFVITITYFLASYRFSMNQYEKNLINRVLTKIK